MIDPSPDAIAASLDSSQRLIILSGPISFSEAESLPEGLFDYDLSWDRQTATRRTSGARPSSAGRFAKLF